MSMVYWSHWRGRKCWDGIVTANFPDLDEWAISFGSMLELKFGWLLVYGESRSLCYAPCFCQRPERVGFTYNSWQDFGRCGESLKLWSRLKERAPSATVLLALLIEAIHSAIRDLHSNPGRVPFRSLVRRCQSAIAIATNGLEISSRFKLITTENGLKMFQVMLTYMNWPSHDTPPAGIVVWTDAPPRPKSRPAT